MSEWKETTWGDISTLEYGKSLKNYQESKGKVPVYGTNGQIGFTDSEPLCNFPSVIIGRKGAYRGVHFSHIPFFVIDTAFYLKPIYDDNIDLKFAYYKLLNQDINRLDSGSAIPSTSRPDFYQLDLLLPPLYEQKSIADVLSCLDAKIENLRRQNDTLEAIAQTLFKDWFIDFEFPNTDGKPYKSSGGAMVRSELGEIPEGWRIGKLGDVVNINSQSIDKNYPHKKIEYVDISSVGVGVLEDTTQYKLYEAPSRARRLVKHGDVIWSGVRPNRKSYLFICKPIENLVVSTGFIVLSPKQIPSSYLYAWVTTPMFVDYLTLNASGSAYPAVKAEHFEIAEIVLPSKAILKDFHSIVDPMRIKIHENSRQIETLNKTRDTLLPKLMSGQLRVKE